MIRRITILCLLLMNINSYSQTKIETVDWLNARANERNAFQWIQYLRANNIEFKYDGTFKITESYNESGKYWFSNAVPVYEITGNLKYFYQNTEIKTEHDDSRDRTIWYVQIRCDKKNCYSQKYIPNDNVAYGKYLKDENSLWIGPYTDEETAKRVSKALTHLIILCGGKKEAF